MLSMQTPIDFGKDFLSKLFDERDADACLKMLAGDLVWITPEDMYHFLTKGEVLSFLKKRAAEEAGTRFVDISSIRSSPSADEIMTVAYEVNLVSKEDEKARPLYLRCSMVICRRDGRLEISFLHFSEKAGGSGAQQLHDFVTNLPCGVMILACLDGQGEEAVFYNDYFARRLRYRQEVFAKKVRRNPFFMTSEEDREKIREEIGKARKNGGNFSVNLRFYRRDGNSFYYKMIGAPAWEAEYGAMYYCVFQETTGYRLAADRLEAQLGTAAGIIRQVPEGLCVIEYSGGEARGSRVIYTSKNIPSMFGVSVSAYTRNILSDPFYGLEITSITREKLMSSSILNKEKAAVGKPVSCGIFRVRRPEEKTGEKHGGKQDAKAPRVELVIRRTQEKNGIGRLYLFYYDREAQQRETEDRIDRAMRMGRAGQDALRDQLEKTKEKAFRAQSELSDALRKEKKKNAETAARFEELLAREKGNSALLTARLAESREDLRKMALELERTKEDASRALKNMLRQAQEDAERERQTMLRKAEEETERRVREARLKAEEEAEIKIREARRKAQEDAERRIREARLKAQEDAEGRIQEARLKAEEDAEGRIQEARLKAEEDAEGRIQEARQKAQEDAEGRIQDRPGGTRAGERQVVSDGGEGRFPLSREHAVGHDTITFSPEECISAVLDLKREECAKKDVSLELYFDSGMPAFVTGFGNLLASALRELVENAVFRARPGGRISVHCRSDRPSEGLITLSFRVDDDGVLISEAGMRTLFRAQPSLYQETDYMEETPDSPDLAAMTHSFVPGGEYWKEDAKETEMEISEAPASDALPSGLFAAREAAALMGGSLHARSSERDTRFLLNVVLHIQTDVFEREL